jgi:PAS domain S-box-containing protein
MLAFLRYWFSRFIGARPSKRKAMHKMSASSNVLRGRWHRARKQLGEALRILKARSAERRNRLGKANDDLKAAQTDLQRRWQYLEEAQKLSHSGTFGWKVIGGELVWSEETRRILGFTDETNPTLDLVFDRIHPEDRDRMQQLKEHAVNNAMDFDVEHRLLLPGGIIKYVHAVAHAGRDSAGNLQYMGVITDVTERKYADDDRQALARKLEESKARLEEAQRIAHVGHWEWDLETNVIVWSDETYRIFGLKPQERAMDLATNRGMIHPDDRESLYSGVDVDLAAGAYPIAEFRIVRPSGEVRTLHAITSKRWSALPVDSNGEQSERPRKLFGTVQDVTEQKRAEEALQRSQFYLSEGQRLAHMGCWAFNDSGHYWSDELYKIYGLDPKNGAPTVDQYLALIHPQDRAAIAESIRLMLQEHRGFDQIERIVRSDGQLRYLRAVAVPVVEQGVFKGFVGTTMDVTEQELLTQELRRERAYLAEAQGLTHVGSWATNFHTGQNHHMSDEIYRLHGFEPSQGPLPLESFWKTVHSEDEPVVRAVIENAIHARADFEVPEYRICLPGGTLRFLRARGHHNPLSEVGEYVGITMDITERKRAEEERQRLRQMENDLAHINRVNMMGELAAALAHEIKQPIAASITSANALLRWLAREPPDLERARAAAARIEQDANRAASVIDSMRSFYKTGTPAERQVVDVKEIVGEIAVLLSSEAYRHAITIRLELETDSLKVLANRVQLQQVFMNLMLNAVEAMKGTGGDLTIRSRSSPEGRLFVSVSDTGIGLPPESTDRIFEPFHSTKPQGTGMGLTITRSIVESYGGRVWATANLGAGATFHFILPCEAEADE